MSQTGLESEVKEHFDLPLVEFMKQKEESDTPGDQEIAPLLKVSVYPVRKIQYAPGIEKANSFIRRFEAKYGVRALETFKSLAENPSHSLADAARRFSFSREGPFLRRSAGIIPKTGMAGSRIGRFVIAHDVRFQSVEIACLPRTNKSVSKRWPRWLQSSLHSRSPIWD